MDFELTRSENDLRLLPEIDSIKTGENFKVLFPFAKAYLGMFYVIDNDLAEKEKVKLLANEDLAEAILQGFHASLKCATLPSIDEIGYAMAEQKEYPEGYVILAGLDLVAKDSIESIVDLPSELINSAVGFHFSNKTNHQNVWFDYLLEEHINKITPAICQYWVAILKKNVTFLPGRHLIIGKEPNVTITQHCILSLLLNWRDCKAKILFQLLQLAFKYSEPDDFLNVCENVLEQDEKLNEKTRLYWIATAYLISPDKYFARLSDYVGRVKLKVMPLLDFVTYFMTSENDININEKAVAQLLRITAPIFPPQHHVYGAFGGLDINSRNVMRLFYYLVCSDSKGVISEIKSLRKARVMKIYSGVIDNLLELQTRKNNEADFCVPDFDIYIEMLAKNNCLEGRSNKFDLR